MLQPLRTFALLPLLALLSACAGYEMGAPESGLSEQIHLAPVTNRTNAPQVRAPFTDALRETFLRTAGWDLRDANQADVQLEVTLTEFIRRRAATSPTDTERGLSVDLILRAEVRVLDPRNGQALRPAFKVEATGLALDDPSFPQNERAALVALCERLSLQIQDRLRDRW